MDGILVVCVTCAPALPPGDSTRIIGAYDEDSIKWIELSPLIAGKASSLQSHERVELTPLEVSKSYNAPLYALFGIVLVEALCRSQAIFSLTLEENAVFTLSAWFRPPRKHTLPPSRL